MSGERSAEFAQHAALALTVGAMLGAAAHYFAPKVVERPAMQEAGSRVTRALHVLRGRPLLYRLRIEDGTIWIDDHHARIDTVTVVGGPPRVAMDDVEAILADALARARSVVHQPPAIFVEASR